MSEQNQDANVQNSSPELSEALVESETTEQQTPETETATPKQAETQEEDAQQEEVKETPFHEHPRWKEVQQEKEWYKQQLESQLQQRQVQQPQAPQQPKQELGNTPEEREFWRMQRQVAREEAQKEVANMKPILDAGRMELAQMKVAQFRSAHSDIVANSPDELSIAQRIQSGYTPDDAYWAVMGPRGVQRAETRVKKQVQQKTQQKRQANVETSSGVSSATQAPANEDFRAEMERRMKEEGL